MYFESGRDLTAFYSENDNICAAHFHRSVEILYVLKGKKTVWVGGERYDLLPAQMLVCPPYAIHVFPPAPDSVQLVVCIPPEFCKRFERFAEGYAPETCVISDENEELLGYLRLFGNARNEVLRDGAAAMILGTFMARVKFLPARDRTSRTKVQEIADYIEAHYAERLSLAGAADAFGYSPNYFSALFKKYFRSGFNAYVNFVRVQKSIPMLKTQKISSVCYDCGFQSPQQYFLNFKKYFGCTPFEYLHKTGEATD